MTEGKKSCSPSVNLPRTFLTFFIVLPLIPELASQYDYRKQKAKRRTTKNPHCYKCKTLIKPRESASPAAGATVGILGIVPCSGEEMFPSQDLFTLLEQPAVMKGNKVETVVEDKSPQKHLQQRQPFGKPSATVLWKALRGKLKPAASTSFTSVTVCYPLLYLLKHR